jgi:hypothetical protein
MTRPYSVTETRAVFRFGEFDLAMKLFTIC